MTVPSINQYRLKLESQGLTPDEVERRVLLANSFTGWMKKKQSTEENLTTPTPQSSGFKVAPSSTIQHKGALYALVGGSLVLFLIIGSAIARTQQTPSTIGSSAAYKPNTRTLSFSGKLTDASGFIIANKTKVVLSLYNDALGGKQIYSSGVCTVTPNMQGAFQTTIGGACGSPIREDVFTTNPQLYLGIKIGNDTEMQPRTPISSRNATSSDAPTGNLAVNDEGEIVLSTETAAIRSTLESANFAITSARGVLLQSSLDGDVTLSATESGQIKFLVGGEQVSTIKAGGELAITGNIIPTNTGIQDLGSSNNRFNALYVENIYPGLSGISGYLKREGNTLSTTNAGDEFILGSSVASLARIRLSPYTSDKSWINAGNFGIGTTNPTFNLDVAGTTRIGGDLTLGASGSQKVNFNTSTLSFANASGIALPGNTVNALAFQTDLLSMDTKNNRIGLGTIAPTNKLTVVDSQANISTLKVENTNSDASSKGLLIKLGFTGGGNTSNEFITFTKGNDEVQGKIQSNGASGVSFTSGGGDFAEYFLKDSSLDSKSTSLWNAGTLICLVADGMVRPCDTTYTNVLGVVSNNAAFVGNSKGEDDEKYTLVGLVGQLPVNASSASGSIASGDPLSYSTIPGEVARATQNMRIVGFAQEAYSGTGTKTIRATIQPGYYEVTQKNQLTYDGTVLGTNRESLRELISRFSNLIAKTIQVEEKISSPVVETGTLVSKTILPAPKSDLIIDLAPEESESSSSASTNISSSGPLAQLIIQGFNNQTVASFDALGNATLSGTLQAQNVETQSVEAQNVNTQVLTSSTLTTQQASVSGTLVANRIEASNITDIEKMVNELKNAPLPDARLYDKDTSVFNSIDPIDEITVLNKASFYDASVANSLLAGSVSIRDDTITGLAFELKLTALASINLLDGAVMIARDGTLTTKGEVIAQKGVRTNHLSPINKGDNLKVSLSEDASQSASLQILNDEAREVASINASGSAFFEGGIGVNTFIADSGDIQNKSSLTAAISTNAQSAGTGEIPVGKSNIIIYNEKLSKNSLVYLTSTSKTENQPVYVSEKKTCDVQITETDQVCRSYFVVTIDSPIKTAATFNWWIIN